MAEAKRDPKAEKHRQEKPEVFHIHSLVRSTETRLQRAQAPSRHRFKQLLGGGLIRLVRRRPVPVAKALVLRLLPELVQKEKEGLLKVTTPDGRRVDLSTLKPAEPVKTAAPKPQPPLDSAENDQSFEEGVGIPMAQAPGGVPQGVELPLPAAARGLPEGVDDESEVTPPENVEEAAQRLYDGNTKAQLVEIAKGLGVDSDGNKMDVAQRLADAGYKG